MKATAVEGKQRERGIEGGNSETGKAKGGGRG